MREIAAAVVAGLVLGVVSRLVDSAAWAPDWIGFVFSPWLAAAWLVGATGTDARAGALRGLVLLAGTVAGYLALASVLAPGALTATLLLGLVAVTALAGPTFGAAGGAWRHGGRRGIVGAAAIGGALVGEGIFLQLGERLLVERLLFGAEIVAGMVMGGTLAWISATDR